MLRATFLRLLVTLTTLGWLVLATPKTLNVTTIAANMDKESVLQCWQLAAPFQSSSTAGVSGAVFAQLGETIKTSLGVIPPKFDGGLHVAPAIQYVVFLSGEAIVTLPNSTDKARIHGGGHGLILAADTKNANALGHYTRYPSKHNTIAVQIPIENKKVPAHKILHCGPCTSKEQAI